MYTEKQKRIISHILPKITEKYQNIKTIEFKFYENNRISYEITFKNNHDQITLSLESDHD